MTIFFIIFLSCASCIFVPINTYAAVVSEDRLYKLAIMQGVPRCYQLYAKDKVQLGDFENYRSIFETDGGFSSTGSNDIHIPTHVGNDLHHNYYNDSNLSCTQVFSGYSGGAGAAKGLKDLGYSIPNSLEGLGYKLSDDDVAGSENEVVIRLDSIKDASGSNTKPVTIKGEITCNGEKVQDGEKYAWRISECSGQINARHPDNYDGEYWVVIEGEDGSVLNRYITLWSYYMDNPRSSGKPENYTNIIEQFAADMNWKGEIYSSNDKNITFKEAFEKSTFNEHLKIYLTQIMYANDVYEEPVFSLSYNSGSGTQGPVNIYKPIGGKKAAGEIMLYDLGVDDNLTHFDVTSSSMEDRMGVRYYWGVSFTYSLYYTYLRNLANEYDGIDITGCGSEKPDSKWMFKNSPTTWCAINMPGAAIDGTGEFDDYGPVLERIVSVVKNQALEEGSIQDILEWLKDENSYKGLPEDIYANAEVNDDGTLNLGTDNNDELNQVEDTCYNSGGAGAVAWIVCPILEWIQDASEDIYNTYVEPALEINPSLFSQDKDEGTRYAWGVFQGFANTIFIILILAVIFSQLTGVGIDNYGIKKILPKLIVAAILINLSYLICLICVDLSNILGNAFQELFGSLGVGADSVSISGGSIPVSGGSGGAITAVVILGVIGGVIVWRNPAILLTLLVSALGVLISIFFLFLLLSARQAAIIILTVLSPLAFVCYILPNTKKFFDRWFKIWEGLLLLFPICGLLIGGGDYASRLLLHALANGEQDLLGAFTAMLVGIAPIFFIPTVLRGSLTALGNLGATISGVGNRLRAGTTKGIRNSEGYKNAQKMGQERRMRYKAGYSEKKGGLTAIGRAKANFAGRLPGRLIGMNKRQAAYVEAAKKNAAIGEESGAVLAAETAAVDIAEYIKNNPGATPKDYFWDQIAKAGGDVRKLNSIILAAEKRGIKKKDIAAGIRNAVNGGALIFASAQSQSNWMNSVLQDHGDIMSTDYELQEWTRKGGVGTLGAYGAYAATNIDASDVDISDYSKMSGVSLAAMIKAGKVSASMAQQWLAANPNASADKKIMMGAVASGAVKGSFAASAEDFKSEAEALANGTAATTHTISGGVAANRPGDTLSDLVDSWTSTAQVRAYVSQDPSSIKPGQRQKDPVDVRIQHGPSSETFEGGAGI